jgi:hypothetical protein
MGTLNDCAAPPSSVMVTGILQRNELAAARQGSDVESRFQSAINRHAAA